MNPRLTDEEVDRLLSKRSFGKWTALINSWRELRARLHEFYDEPDVSHIDDEIERLQNKRTEWRQAQRKAVKAARRAARSGRRAA